MPTDIEQDADDVEVLSDDGPIEGNEEDAPASDSVEVVTTGSRALDRRDPLALYMQDVRRYRLLTREEEQELALRYTEHGDLDAARELVTSNLRLVVKIAYNYRHAYQNILDLVQEGNVGLMQAVKKFDPYKGVKLSSYAGWWIRAYMLRFILNNHRLVKLGTTQAQRKLFFNLQKEKNRLAAMGIEPTHEMIAERLSVPVRDVVSMDARLSAGETSLDATVGAEDGGRKTSRIELLPSGEDDIDDVLAEDEVGQRLKQKLREYGETLEGRDKIIFEERLLAETPKTLKDLGEEFGVSRERVRQVESRLMDRMRAYLESEAAAAVDAYES